MSGGVARRDAPRARGFGRWSLFEVEDQPWLPQWLRGYLTDFLCFLFSALVHRTRVAERLAEVLEHTGAVRVVDLGSGSGGALPAVCRDLAARRGRAPDVLLTDKYPNLEAFAERRAEAGGGVDFVATSIDATDVPAELEGVRTLFSAFHHFEPDAARRILHDAAAKGRGLAVFEISERRAATLALMLAMPLAVWLATPWLRPFSWRRLFFTYAVPVVPLLVFWDGVVSCWRTYTVDELRRLAASVRVPGYRFEAGRDAVRGLPAATTWLLGYPTR